MTKKAPIEAEDMNLQLTDSIGVWSWHLDYFVSANSGNIAPLLQNKFLSGFEEHPQRIYVRL